MTIIKHYINSRWKWDFDGSHTVYDVVSQITDQYKYDEVPLRSDHIYSTFMGVSIAIRSYIQYIYGKFLFDHKYKHYIYEKILCDQIIYTVHVWVVPMRPDHRHSSCMGSSYAIRSYIQYIYG